MFAKTAILEDLSSFITEFDFQSLPEPVVAKVKLCVFHALACSFAGHDLPWSQTAINFLKDLHVGGNATSLVDGLKGPAPDVAFVNSVMGHSIIQEDMHLDSMSHPGSIVIPAAFAVADDSNCTGRALIVAITLGYEMMSRIGTSIVSPEFAKTFRASGVFGPYGSATAAAKILRLSGEQTRNALGMAANMSLGLNQWAVEGTDDLYYHNGLASSNGIRAAMLARSGAEISKSIIEGPAGVWAAYGKQEAAGDVAIGLGESFEILDVYYKVAPACAFVQTGDILALNMARDRNIELENVERIVIKTFKAAKDYPGLDYTGPFTSIMQAKMSLPYGVAAVLVFKEIGQGVYDRFDDPLVAQIATRCELESDAEISVQYPEKQGCRIEIHMRDGSVISDAQEDVGVMSEDEVVENFRLQASKFFESKHVEELTDNIKGLDEIKQTRHFTALCVKRGS